MTEQPDTAALRATNMFGVHPQIRAVILTLCDALDGARADRLSAFTHATRCEAHIEAVEAELVAAQGRAEVRVEAEARATDAVRTRALDAEARIANVLKLERMVHEETKEDYLLADDVIYLLMIVDTQ